MAKQEFTLNEVLEQLQLTEDTSKTPARSIFPLQMKKVVKQLTRIVPRKIVLILISTMSEEKY